MTNAVRNLLFVSAGLVCALLGFFIANQHFSKPLELKSAQLLPGQKKIADVQLESTQEETLDESFLSGHWTLVFFGFTSCPDFCPMELQKLGRVMRMSEEPDLQVLFVSVDPERDTNEKLKAYVEFFHPGITGAIGTNKEIARFAQLFGASYDRSFILDKKLHEISAGMDMPADAGDFYQVNHSLRIFIVNPLGNYIGSFAPPHDAEIILDDINAIMKESGI